MQIRRYRPGEEAAIWAVYFEATRQTVARDYTAAQVQRWAPAGNVAQVKFINAIAPTQTGLGPRS